MPKRCIHVGNQRITFKEGATFIEISYPPELNINSNKTTLRFNLITEWKNHRDELWKNKRPTYYWLSTLRYQILEEIHQKIKEVEYKINLLEKSIN